MNKIRYFSAVLITALAASPVVSAGDSLIYGNVSSWTVHTDPEHSYRCFTEVRYEGGTSIRIGYNTTAGDLYLSVSDASWGRMSPGSEQDMTISFDDTAQRQIAGNGIAMGARGESAAVSLAIPGQSRQSFLRDFMARHTMTVSIASAEAIDLSLAGSHRAALMLEECQVAMARVAARTE